MAGDEAARQAANEAARQAAQQAASEPMTDLRGRVALVTGASSGIGEAMARRLVQKGAHVTLAARRVERLHAFTEQLASEGQGQTHVVACDVREAEDVQRAVSETVERFGGLDILIANAGFGYRSPIVDGDITRWKDMFDTNVYGLLLTLKYGVPPIVQRGRGDVIVLSSVAGRVVSAGGAAYSGSKFAVTAIAEALRSEVGKQNVRVMTLEPGVVLTEFQEKALYTPQTVANMLTGAVPLIADDIARAAIFALEQPAHFALNEVVVRPTGQIFP